jgi:hypothetical protein
VSCISTKACSRDTAGEKNTAETIVDASSLTFESTRHGLIGTQELANSIGHTSNTIVNIGKLKLAGDLNVELAGEGLGALSTGLTIYDMTQKGINFDNGTDLVFDVVSFVPYVGWVISGTYFLTNTIIKAETGQSIGDHLENLSNNLNFMQNYNPNDVFGPDTSGDN